MNIFKYIQTQKIIHQGNKGQSMVETAIILPLFIFIILGLIQMSQVYQAQAMLKYAAFRATRTGTMTSINLKEMKKIALIVMAPVSGASGKIRGGGVDSLAINLGVDSANMKVVICGPLQSWLSGNYRGAYNGNQSVGEVDFDDPLNTYSRSSNNQPGSGEATVKQFERTKLKVQLQYKHRLVVPFANKVIYDIYKGRAVMSELRMNRKPLIDINVNIPGVSALVGYKLPMFANYALRMQSNFVTDNLPTEEMCISPKK